MRKTRLIRATTLQPLFVPGSYSGRDLTLIIRDEGECCFVGRKKVGYGREIAMLDNV